ncbi:MAG: hypothetical protein HQL03_00055 [Nitrospirae bacterium]|nr:hypothetical protein [Nitrospirota bacterium]MBF0593009.1 hypothetical protein [Nitrospirota bacterium]
MSVTLPIEVYEALEKGLGRDEAKRVIKAFETAISDVTEYKWRTSKDELLTEMEKRFATKADLALLEAKMKLYFLVLIFVIILTNSRALDLLYKFLVFLK